MEVKMKYQVCISSLLDELQENCWKGHNFCPLAQSTNDHDNIYSERETNWFHFIQKDKWPGVMVWLPIVKKNIQSNEHTAMLLIYRQVVLQALHWCERPLHTRLEVYLLLKWIKVFEGVLYIITMSKCHSALDQRD